MVILSYPNPEGMIAKDHPFCVFDAYLQAIYI